MPEHIRTGRVCALILAGGRSTRMGRDKATVPLGGHTLLERAVSFWRACPPIADVLVAAGARTPDPLPAGTVCVPDLFPGCGPMAGLHAAFSLTDAEVLYVSAVDMPFLTQAALLPEPVGDAAVYTKDGRPEPLFGVYRRTALPVLDEALRAGRHRMTDALARMDVTYHTLPEALAAVTENLNTPQDLMRARAGSPPAVAFVGWSGSGKTTFLEKLLPALSARGVRAAVIKRDAHGIEMDRPGKDTWRLARAGAVCTAISGPNGWAVLGRDEIGFDELRQKLPPTDIVLVEGHKYSGLPKVEIHRSATGKPFITHDDTLLAAVTDERISGIGAPQLGLDDVEACAELIYQTFLKE